MSIDHEHRGRPITAAYHDPQVAAPERASHRAATSWWRPWLTGPARNIREWVTAEWKTLGAYLIGAVVVFAAIATAQSYWPNETMAVWGAAWRIAAICAGANLFVLLLLELSLKPTEQLAADENAHTCRTCGEHFDNACVEVSR